MSLRRGSTQRSEEVGEVHTGSCLHLTWEVNLRGICHRRTTCCLDLSATAAPLLFAGGDTAHFGVCDILAHCHE